MHLNDRDLEDRTKVYLFPGHYTLTTNNEDYEIIAGDLFVKSTSSLVDFSSFAVGFTSAGRTVLAEAASRYLNLCLSQHLFRPQFCGFGSPASAEDGTALNEATMVWRVAAGDISRAEFYLDPGDLSWAYSDVNIAISGEVDSADGTSTYTVESLIDFIDIKRSETGQLTVIFT